MKSLINRVYSCEMESTAITIGSALFWAAAMILAGWLSRGSEYADAIFLVLLTASTTAILYNGQKRKNN